MLEESLRQAIYEVKVELLREIVMSRRGAALNVVLEEQIL